jgi:peptidoglycan/LPS O-acetylase OafA/YrhL
VNGVAKMRGDQSEILYASRLAVFGRKTLLETIDSHDNNYTLIRLVLSASVIYFHSFALSNTTFADYLSAPLTPISDVGGLAVKLFFFLSGLFVAQSFHKDPGILGFALKRFLRIWPGYFVCLLVTALLLVAVAGDAPFSHYLRFTGLYDYVLRNSVFDLTWGINGVLFGHRMESLNGSIHTLPMEAKMYVVMGCIGVFGLMRTRPRIALAGAIALLLAASPAVKLLPFDLFNAKWSRPAGLLFLAGMVAYGLSARIRLGLWQGAVLLVALQFSSGIVHEVLFYASAVWAMLMIGQADWIGRLLRPRQDLSYGIYVYGWPCQQIVLALVSTTLNPYLLTLLALLLAGAFAALSWRFVEKPAIGLGKQLVVAPGLAPLARHRGLVATLSLLFLACWTTRWTLLKWDLMPVQRLSAQIIDFGPKESREGKSINQQPNGDSAIWLKLDGDPGPGTVVVMDGHRLKSQASAGLATAQVDESILSSVGDKSIYLERRFPNRIERSGAVTLKVIP